MSQLALGVFIWFSIFNLVPSDSKKLAKIKRGDYLKLKRLFEMMRRGWDAVNRQMKFSLKGVNRIGKVVKGDGENLLERREKYRSPPKFQKYQLRLRLRERGEGELRVMGSRRKVEVKKMAEELRRGVEYRMVVYRERFGRKGWQKIWLGNLRFRGGKVELDCSGLIRCRELSRVYKRAEKELKLAENWLELYREREKIYWKIYRKISKMPGYNVNFKRIEKLIAK